MDPVPRRTLARAVHGARGRRKLHASRAGGACGSDDEQGNDDRARLIESRAEMEETAM